MFHKIIIVRRLGAEPEQKYTVDGKAVTSFSVAAENRKDETLWFRVSAWEKLAEVCGRYLKKGAKVLVEGTLKADENGSPRVFGRKDGTWASSYEVTASSVKFLSGKDEPAVNDDVPF